MLWDLVHICPQLSFDHLPKLPFFHIWLSMFCGRNGNIKPLYPEIKKKLLIVENLEYILIYWAHNDKIVIFTVFWIFLGVFLCMIFHTVDNKGTKILNIGNGKNILRCTELLGFYVLNMSDTVRNMILDVTQYYIWCKKKFCHIEHIFVAFLHYPQDDLSHYTLFSGGPERMQKKLIIILKSRAWDTCIIPV